MPFGGYLAVIGHLNFWGVVIAGTLGNLIGSLIAYYIGRYGGKLVVLKFGRRLHLSEHHLQRAETWFAKYGEISVLLGRIFPVIRTFISLPAGIAQMRLWRFVVYTTAGSLPWVYMLTWAGADLGKHWENTVRVIHPITYLILIAIVIFCLLYLSRRGFLGKRK